ncbi:hypothetical protein F8388_018149 [Cannabis sativa]|uniref:Zinc knuckle CX2CX4HX4C domain-containing protein n=1 Tax=Cannabis sativa TaxID=3483 RepID=A0A7J6GAR5_CANSA|nr:hypothetical protein F8388_018149 [Cannabis sativa]
MDEVGESSSGINGRCLSLNEVSIALVPSVVTTKILSKLCLYGKIISSRTFPAKDVKIACSSLWNTRVCVETTDGVLAGANIFQFIFDTGAVCKRILEQGPWCVKGDMLALLSWSSGFGACALSFNSIRFWIQIHLLPHDYYSRTNANMLGALAGKVVTIELEESKPVTWNKWIRVLVEVDVNRPLCCDCFFKSINGDNKCIQLKYEKLEVFCFKCGLLGHQRRDWMLLSPVTVLNEKGVPFPLFGPWLTPLSKYDFCFSVNRTGVACERIKEKSTRDMVISGGSVGRELGGGAMREGLVQSAWRPKATGDEIVTVPHSGVHSLSPKLNIGKPFETFPLKEPILNLVGIDEVNIEDRLRCQKNRVNRLTPTVDHVACKKEGSVHLNSFNKSCGPPMLANNGPLGPSCGSGVKTIERKVGRPGPIGVGPVRKSDLLITPVAIIAKEREDKNVSSTSVLGQDYSEHLDEKRALTKFFQAQEGYLHETGAGLCDIGVQPTLETNERTTPVKKQRLDVESHSLKTVPKWNLGRVKCVVRDFPRGVGPRGNEPDGSRKLPRDSEESSLGDGSSPMAVSAGHSHQVDKPISAGQSLRLMAWKARARLTDIAIPEKDLGGC